MRTFWKLLTRAHKWAGLVLGVQIFLWIASGLFMTVFPIDQVRGRHIAKPLPFILPEAPNAIGPGLSIDALMDDYAGDVYGITMRMIGADPAFAVEGARGETYYSSTTGQRLAPVSIDVIRASADHVYTGRGTPITTRLLSDAPADYRGTLPVWQIRYDDSARTRLYIDPQTGDLKSVRTRLWRAFDVAWKLHIMDWKSGENFNTWWLRLAAAMATLFALSGLALVVHRVVLRPRPKRSKSRRVESPVS